MRSIRRSSLASRNSASSSIASSNTNRVPNGPEGSDVNHVGTLHSDSIATKHISISYAASDPTLVYESIVLFFSLSAFFLQLLHLYRTVWWLPQSYTQYAVVNLFFINYIFNKAHYIHIFVCRNFILSIHISLATSLPL